MRSVDILLIAVAAVALLLIEPSRGQRRSRLATGAGQPVEFDCPEEFGYYPHPTDCTQYYVCVFGGALLESCTGGLMYSHELQTCDWPRNVGCAGAGESATISTVRITDPRTRQTTPAAQQNTRATAQASRDQVQQRQQEEIAKHQLYADDLGPAEEIENDRQQRVYRGQPSTVGQVARDRDGLRHQPATNSIPASRTSSAEKVAVISFGNQQQTQNTQYRYPARILQIVPPGARGPWPSPPSPSVHSAGSGGNFKFQGNNNRNKPPRLIDPINIQDENFQPNLNPTISPDIRNFRSPEQQHNSKAQSTPNFFSHDTNYGHRPPINQETDPHSYYHTHSNQKKRAKNNLNGNPPGKHSGGGSSPAHSIIIPSSYATFQNLPDVPLHFTQQTLANQSLGVNIPSPNSSPYQNTNEEDNFSFFHLDHENSQAPHYISTPSPVSYFSASPTLSNLLTTLKNAEILVGQNPQNSQRVVNNNNGLQFLKSLTSLHEVPYNSDGTRLYQVPHVPHHELDVSSDFNAAHLLHHLVSQSNFPALNNYQTKFNNHHLTSNVNAGKSPIASVTTTQAPFTPNSNPYGIRFKEEKKQPNAQDYQQNDTSVQFTKSPIQFEQSPPKKPANPVNNNSPKPSGKGESDNSPSKEYSSEEDDYYDDSGEDFVDNRYRRPPTYNSKNKFKKNENPFSDVNFDFDKYIDKLKGGYETTVKHPTESVKQKGTVPGTYEKNEDYEDYSEEDYEEYDESEEKPLNDNKPTQVFRENERPIQYTNYPSSTEASNSLINVTSVTRSRLPIRNESTVSSYITKSNPILQSKIPDTLTVPFFHGPDGNIYSRLPVPSEQNVGEQSTSHPFPLHVSTHRPTGHKDLHRPSNGGMSQGTKFSLGLPPQSNVEYTGLRERERVPSYKGFRDFSHQLKTTSTTTTTTTTSTTTRSPVPIHLRPSTNLHNHSGFYKNILQESRLNRSHPTLEHTGIQPPSHKYFQDVAKETPIQDVLGYYLSDYDKEHASSTTRYPVKVTKEPLTNYHYKDNIYNSTQASVVTEVSRTTKIPPKHFYRPRNQSSHFNGERKVNNPQFMEGTNIFSSVKDTISIMSNNSESSNFNINSMIAPSKSTSPANVHFTSLPPPSTESSTTPHTYTIRRRPPKVQSTTPQYRVRKPSSASNSSVGNIHSPTLPRPETMNIRPNRRPTTKNRSRTTTTERTTSSTHFDRNASTDKPKSIITRHNKKVAPDKDGSRTTNILRVEPSAAPVAYVQRPAVQVSSSPATYNNTQQYESSPYDPYYSLYDDEVELYRDVDYSQYTPSQPQANNQQYRGQSPYKQTPQQPEIQAQRNVAYSQPTYNTQDVYSQTSGTQNYNENYNTELANDQIQYRQQTAKQVTKAPSSNNRIETNTSFESTSTTAIPTTTSNKPTTIRTTTTTTIVPAVVSSRQLTRQRVEIKRSTIPPSTWIASAISTTPSSLTPSRQVAEEIQSIWNLPYGINSSSETTSLNDSLPVTTPNNVPIIREPESPQGNARAVPGSSSPSRSSARRITLTASLSLDEPFATGGRGKKVPNSPRRGLSTDDNSTSRSNSWQESPEESSRSVKNNQRNQIPSRRVATKSFIIADVPNSNLPSIARDSGIVTVDDIIEQTPEANPAEIPSRRVSNRVINPEISETSRKTFISSSEPAYFRVTVEETSEVPKGSLDSFDTNPNYRSNISQASKLVLTQESPRSSASQPFNPTIESTYYSETESGSNSISTSNSFSQPPLSRSESTSRARSRDGIRVKPCRDEVDSNTNTDCSEKPPLRVRTTTAPSDRKTTPSPARGSSSGRNRGNPAYTASTASDAVNRGTPASVRTRPTLKPSTAIVPKAQEFVDIYRFPPLRPDSLYPTPQVDKTAAKCRKDVCLLPDCYCGGKDIPGGYAPEEIPQIVLLTFDDSANDLNKGLYSDLFDTGRKNANGCPISATFYVSHEWTDYSHVQNLYAGGHEIASHSISHSFGEQFSQKKWTREIGGQREILAAYGGVKLEDIRGMRAPFLAIGGNKMFKMLYDSNFTYDSSMPVYENRPPSWPYTLDYKIFHDCMIPPCPTRSYPGVWEVPMVMWQDLNGGRCSMGDACSNPPTSDGVYKMLIKNFERHYTTNRAPFGLFYHAAWFTQPHHKEGFEAFLDTIVNMPDVWLVTNWQAIQWMRDPTPLSRINSFQPWQCNYPDRPKKCNNPKVCNLWHKSGVRYMRTCQPCPDIYPWTGKTGVRNSRVDNEVIEE